MLEMALNILNWKNFVKIVLWSYAFDAHQTFHAMHMTWQKKITMQNDQPNS